MNSIELDVVVGQMTAHRVSVTAVGANLYRLDEYPGLFDDSLPRFGDILLTESVDSQTIRCVSVHQRGPFRHYRFLLTRQTIESATTISLLAAVVAAGGHWEQQMGGILLIAVPEDSALDPNDVFSR